MFFSKKFFFFVKENETYFEIFENILFVELKISKLNYLLCKKFLIKLG